MPVGGACAALAAPPGAQKLHRPPLTHAPPPSHTPAQFTGSTAAGLTAAQLTGGINSLADLRGRPVIVWDVYEPQLRATGAQGWFSWLCADCLL